MLDFHSNPSIEKKNHVVIRGIKHATLKWEFNHESNIILLFSISKYNITSCRKLSYCFQPQAFKGFFFKYYAIIIMSWRQFLLNIKKNYENQQEGTLCNTLSFYEHNLNKKEYFIKDMTIAKISSGGNVTLNKDWSWTI